MKTISIKYPTITKQRRLGDKVFVLETIRDLDEAIDIVCQEMTPEEQLDPFAEDLCPYFGVLWPAAEALAQYVSENHSLISRKTILELGCGLGFPSMVASHLGGIVTATDFHPDVEEYFLRNCRHSSVTCSYERLNWRENSKEEKFDIVMGSDILYESKHPREVAKSLVRFVKTGGIILLSDPGRNHLQKFVQAMNDEGFKEELSFLTIEGQDVFLLKYQV